MPPVVASFNALTHSPPAPTLSRPSAVLQHELSTAGLPMQTFVNTVGNYMVFSDRSIKEVGPCPIRETETPKARVQHRPSQ